MVSRVHVTSFRPRSASNGDIMYVFTGGTYVTDEILRVHVETTEL